MFYGAHLKSGVVVTPPKKDDGEVLHLSQVCLVDPKEDGKTYVQVTDGGNTYCIAVLKKDQIEQVSLDIFISTQNETKLSLKGAKNEVHITGYFEPEEQPDDDDLDSSLLDDFNDRHKIEDLDEDEDEDEDDDDKFESKDSGDLQDDDDDDDNLDDSDDEEDKQPKKKDQGKGKGKKNEFAPQKRKVEKKGAVQTDAKKAKKEVGKIDPEADKSFQNELVKYLTTNGKTNLGALGQKVKRPAHVDKLGTYIKEHSNVFKLENGMVSLK